MNGTSPTAYCCFSQVLVAGVRQLRDSFPTIVNPIFQSIQNITDTFLDKVNSVHGISDDEMVRMIGLANDCATDSIDRSVFCDDFRQVLFRSTITCCLLLVWGTSLWNTLPRPLPLKDLPAS